MTRFFSHDRVRSTRSAAHFHHTKYEGGKILCSCKWEEEMRTFCCHPLEHIYRLAMNCTQYTKPTTSNSAETSLPRRNNSEMISFRHYLVTRHLRPDPTTVLSQVEVDCGRCMVKTQERAFGTG
eukprot:969110-Prorocentrum_minimum.AAC.4